MTDFPFAIIGFDLDGTLVESHVDLGQAVNHALGRIGRAPIEPGVTRNLVGGGARVMLERALEVTGGPVDAATFEGLFAALIDHYRAHIADHSRPYPGCLAALDALAARGCRLAVVTNKREDMAVALLDALGMRARFAAILGGDTLGDARRKPAPDLLHEAAARCGGGAMAMVGDSRFDADAARAAGMPCVLVDFGYSDVDVTTLGADAVIGDYAELLPVLAKWPRVA